MVINKEKNGTWTIRDKVKCADNEFHQMSVRGYSKKSDATNDYSFQREQFLKRFDKRISNGIIKANQQGIRLCDVVDEFVFDYSTKNARASYLKLIETIELRFYKYFDKTLLANDVFQENNIREWKASLIALPLSTDVKNKTISIVKRILNRGMLRDIIDAKDGGKCILLLDSLKNTVSNKKRKVDFWLPEEYYKFAQTFNLNDKYKFIFDTFFYCGLRIGEMCGLQWKNFDEERHVLSIDHQVNNKLKTGKWEITAPKTKNAYRDIYLNEQFYNELLEFKRLTYGNDPNDFIFFGSKPVSRTAITRHFDNHIISSGVKKIRIHDLRHTHASLMIHLGADPKFIMERLGHASYEETMSVYGHMFPNKARDIVSLLDNCMKEENKVISI